MIIQKCWYFDKLTESIIVEQLVRSFRFDWNNLYECMVHAKYFAMLDA